MLMRMPLSMLLLTLMPVISLMLMLLLMLTLMFMLTTSANVYPSTYFNTFATAHPNANANLVKIFLS